MAIDIPGHFRAAHPFRCVPGFCSQICSQIGSLCVCGLAGERRRSDATSANVTQSLLADCAPDQGAPDAANECSAVLLKLFCGSKRSQSVRRAEAQHVTRSIGVQTDGVLETVILPSRKLRTYEHRPGPLTPRLGRDRLTDGCRLRRSISGALHDSLLSIQHPEHARFLRQAEREWLAERMVEIATRLL